MARRSRSAKPGPAAVPVCQVAGCTVDLRSEHKAAYCIKRRLCQHHIKADAVQRDGDDATLYRFCFQCGKLEPLARFLGQQRSCLASLQQRRAGAFNSSTLGHTAEQHCGAGAVDGMEHTHPATTADAAVDCRASLGGSTAAMQQAAPQPQSGGLLSAGPPRGQAPQQSDPAAFDGCFCTASAVAELADVFCGDSSSTSEELDAAVEAVYGDVAEGLCWALVGLPPAVPAEHSDSNTTYEQLLEQLLMEGQLPPPDVQLSSGGTAAGASLVYGGEPACTLAQHSAWAHGDAPAPPSAIPGMVAEHKAPRLQAAGQAPAAVRAGVPAPPAGSQWSTLVATRSAGQASASPEAQARLQHLQCCYEQLWSVLMYVSDVSTSALPLLM